MCSVPKLSKYVTVYAFTYNAIQWAPILENSSGFITYATSFTLLGKLSLE